MSSAYGFCSSEGRRGSQLLLERIAATTVLSSLFRGVANGCLAVNFAWAFGTGKIHFNDSLGSFLLLDNTERFLSVLAGQIVRYGTRAGGLIRSGARRASQLR